MPIWLCLSRVVAKKNTSSVFLLFAFFLKNIALNSSGLLLTLPHSWLYEYYIIVKYASNVFITTLQAYYC